MHDKDLNNVSFDDFCNIFLDNKFSTKGEFISDKIDLVIFDGEKEREITLKKAPLLSD